MDHKNKKKDISRMSFFRLVLLPVRAEEQTLRLLNRQPHIKGWKHSVQPLNEISQIPDWISRCTNSKNKVLKASTGYFKT